MALDNENIVWIDCEMTGLNLQQDALLEIAVLITNSQLKILDNGINIIIKPPNQTLTTMSKLVKNMHRKSGLLEELENGIPLKIAEEQVLNYLKTWIPTAKKAPLAGNTISVDRAFISRDMTQVDEHLHYRLIDVSTIKELAKRWYPTIYSNAPKKKTGHRALADIIESIEELRYYRETMFSKQSTA